MDYIIAAGIHTDEVHLVDGRIAINQGGCGMYAMSGLRVFTKEVLPISGIEDDFLALHGDWYKRNGITTKGLCERLDFHARTVIQYHPDGTRTDAPTVGIAKNRTRNALISEVEQFCDRDIAGLYTFRNFDAQYIEALIRLKKQHGFKLMWEIAADGAMPEYLDQIAVYARDLDIFSINMDEAKVLFASEDEEQIKTEFRRCFPCWVFLRVGSRGAYMITPDSCCHCPSVPNARVVDTTGGGNSSSGAVLYAYCQGDSPLLAGIKGSVAASYIIAQFGPPQDYPADMTERAQTQVQALYEEAIRCKR